MIGFHVVELQYMQFLVVGLDGKDEKAMERRMAAREAHIEMGDKLVESGNV